MRVSILACVQTSAAVMTQVGQIMDIGLAKLQSLGHGGKNGTVAFTITTGVTDLQLSVDFFFVGIQEWNQVAFGIHDKFTYS
jgi:hypothetical protein